MASVASQSFAIVRANGGAAAPKPGHSARWWRSGKTPLPWIVVATGAPSRSASSMRCAARAGRAEAEVQERPVGGVQRDGGLADLLLRRRGGGVSGRGLERHVVGEEVEVRRDLDEHGARRARARDRARPADRGVELRAVGRQELRLGDRPHHRELVHVVELVCLPGVAADAAAEDEHRHVVQERLADPRHGVRQPRAGDDVGARHLPRGAPHRVRTEGRALLVGHQHGAHRLRLGERVVQLDVVRPRNAEGERDPLVLEGTHDDPPAGHAHLTRLRAAPALPRAAFRPRGRRAP